MSVFIDVWHRTHPLDPEAHARFLDYYGEFVVAPPSEYFEVVGGFRYLDGPTNEDFALYRYASMGRIEASMRAFGADPDFVGATERLFREIEIEETRGVAIHLPYSSDDRLDALIAEGANRSEGPAGRGAPGFLRSVRRCGGTARAAAFEALAGLSEAIEKTGAARLVAGFEYLVGPVMDLVEIWALEPGRAAQDLRPEAVDPERARVLASIAPERERRSLAPTAFSKLR